MLKDENKLFDYLQGDEKYETRAFQVDFQQRLIRKKIIHDPSKVHDVQKSQQEVEENREEAAELKEVD